MDLGHEADPLTAAYAWHVPFAPDMELLARMLPRIEGEHDFAGFQSSGTVAMYQALESEGTVYARIPAGSEGMGRVRVVIGDRERYYKAVTDGDALPRDAKIRVVEINDENNSVKVVEA